jgi:hypothetical protein
MKHRRRNKATFVEVISSIRFPEKRTGLPSGPWPDRGFAVNQSNHPGEAMLDDHKLVRSSN